MTTTHRDGGIRTRDPLNPIQEITPRTLVQKRSTSVTAVRICQSVAGILCAIGAHETRTKPRTRRYTPHWCLTAALVALGACAQVPAQPSSQAFVLNPYTSSRVERFTDSENGAVCYVYRGYGISCVALRPSVEVSK